MPKQPGSPSPKPRPKHTRSRTPVKSATGETDRIPSTRLNDTAEDQQGYWSDQDSYSLPSSQNNTPYAESFASDDMIHPLLRRPSRRNTNQNSPRQLTYYNRRSCKPLPLRVERPISKEPASAYERIEELEREIGRILQHLERVEEESRRQHAKDTELISYLLNTLWWIQHDQAKGLLGTEQAVMDSFADSEIDADKQGQG